MRAEVVSMTADNLDMEAICFVAFHLYTAAFGTMPGIAQKSIHLGFLLVIFYINAMVDSEKRWEQIFLGIMALFALGGCAYITILDENLQLRAGIVYASDILFAILLIIAIFEACRRKMGNPLVIITLVFVAYAFLGKYIPGFLNQPGMTLKKFTSLVYLTTDGIFGSPLYASASYVVLFVLLGAIMSVSGIGDYMTNLATSLFGHMRGGPAKVAVVASGFFGSISGSPTANVIGTGTFTIPMMKKNGFEPEFAAAVEAVASTGGQFTPPIMGAVGFVMAEFMCVSYTKVMLAAAIPAFLYYLSLLYSVHLEAKRLGLSGLSKENIPNAGKVFRERGHLLIPLVVLLGLMFTGYTPLFAAIVAIFVTIPVSWIRKDTRMDLKTIVQATVEGSRSAIGVGISCIIIGVIIGSVNMTSLGLNFGNLILRVVGDGHLFLGGLMVMIMSIILGMGVPGVAAYVIVYVVAVPVLRGVGATEMAANMFCLIYACLSNITPPVAMSSYVAAGIADSNMTKTSLIAMKLGIAGFILPFFFLNNPVLLYGSTEGVALSETIRTFVTATVGVLAIAEGLSGFPMQKYTMQTKALRVLTRVMLIAGGLLFVNPTFTTDVVALVLIAAEVALDRGVLAKAKPIHV